MAGLAEIHAIAQNSRRKCYHWRRGSPCCHAAASTYWSIALTARGGEGMVVKLCDSTARGRRGLVQPAVKCRGRQYGRNVHWVRKREVTNSDLRMDRVTN